MVCSVPLYSIADVDEICLGFTTCLSLFVEDKRRREELALYVTPKVSVHVSSTGFADPEQAMESGWAYLKAAGLVKPLPLGGEVWLNVMCVETFMA